MYGIREAEKAFWSESLSKAIRSSFRIREAEKSFFAGEFIKSDPFKLPNP
ncbi:hypothetical protein MKY25_13725 [Geobacillus sp. FSL W8-0032]|uniref:Uncharacterized protein n=1 Tax=Geobacillus icigianus TaxID=1430331 RepID=A0ABU6BBZ1_9BACL|nr:hypothetical protein [Geobacillus icigianus]MEB3749223.1 hypothetical protein [Geobacillus icigianus]